MYGNQVSLQQSFDNVEIKYTVGFIGLIPLFYGARALNEENARN